LKLILKKKRGRLKRDKRNLTKSNNSEPKGNMFKKLSRSTASN